MSYLSRFNWYVRRMSRMSPAEIGWRVREQMLRRAWARRQVLPGSSVSGTVPGLLPGKRRFTAVLPAPSLVPPEAKSALTAEADRILKGEWEMLGVTRTDLDAPDWFRDPVTGRRSDPSRYAFAVNHRSEDQVGNVKQVWEISRLQHLTLVACAYYLTGTETYASFVSAQLDAWWRANPFLSGVNWTSGIELGIRLVNFTWIRRLLSTWPGVTGLFEENDLFLRQLRWHSEYLAAFESRGSSANNHVIAEAAGLLAGSCAFPWFTESTRWRRHAADLLARSLAANTFGSGINRELATDYHGFVFELGAYACIEASLAGRPVGATTWRLLMLMADCMAALVDSECQPPRQGDSDEGRVILLDPPAHNRWPSLLSLADALFGRRDWWPAVAPDIGSGLAAALFAGLEIPRAAVTGRPAARPSRFEDAGITILRTEPGDAPEIWCRCDSGPHGFESIAAHAHADALSVEVRHGGTEILADPGTYCYHGEPEWRSYFRSTIAHNTAEIGGRSQSVDAGPFLWSRHARTRRLPAPDGGWSAEHDGYAALGATHLRAVHLAGRRVVITDVIETGPHEVRLAFHLGPQVRAKLDGPRAQLIWEPGKADRPGTAAMNLPAALEWQLHRGETEPILGWYSSRLGSRIPAFTLVGTGQCHSDSPLVTTVDFAGEVL